MDTYTIRLVYELSSGIEIDNITDVYKYGYDTECNTYYFIKRGYRTFLNPKYIVSIGKYHGDNK